MRAHPAHPGCDKHGEGLSGDGVVYVEGKALTVGAHQYCPRVYRGQGVPVGLEIHARVSRHSRHEHEHIRPSGACSIAKKNVRAGKRRLQRNHNHSSCDLPLASTPLAFEGGLCGGLRVDKSAARSRWRWNLVSLLSTVPEDKETTRHVAYGVGLVMLLPEQPVVFATKDHETVVLALGYAQTMRKPPPPEPPPDGPETEKGARRCGRRRRSQWQVSRRAARSP